MSPANILVIEDDAPIRALLEAVLNRGGQSFDMVGDGRSALQKLRAGDGYDVVLLDLLLPDVSGFDVLREMRATAPPLVPRTIVMTAAAEPAVIGRSDLDGTWRIFLKPLDINDLLDEIDACREQRPRSERKPSNRADLPEKRSARTKSCLRVVNASSPAEGLHETKS